MRSRIPALCALLVAVGLVPGAAAQEQDGPTLELSLDDAVERALDGMDQVEVSYKDSFFAFDGCLPVISSVFLSVAKPSRYAPVQSHGR